MNASILPSRFRESAFRYYEPTISTIVLNYPNETTLTRGDLSPETFTCRLRDAMRSFRENKWSSEIDWGVFNKIYPTIQICQDRKDGRIFAKVTRIESLSDIQQEYNNNFNENQEVFDIGTAKTHEVVSLIGFLCHNQKLTCPISFQTDHHELIEELKTNLDIYVEKRGDKYIMR